MNAARVTLGLAVLVLLVACGGGGQAPGANAPPPRRVQLVNATSAELPRKAAVTGVLAAQEELVLGLEVAGRLELLDIDVGDTIEPGTVVAALAPREFELAVERAKAAVVAAEARLGPVTNGDLGAVDVESTPVVREAQAVVGEARLHRDRIVTMVQERLTSGAELETAAAALAVAESRLQRARDDVRTSLAEARLRRVEALQAEKRLADSRVTAPWRGRVGVRHATAGQVLAAGSPVVTLLRIDPLRLRLRVPDRLAEQVAIGQNVEFTVDGADGQGSDGVVRKGRIVRAGPAIERGDRTRLFEAEVANADGALLPGAFCRAQIVTAPAVPVVTVPRSAVVTFAGVDRVFTVTAPAAGGARAKGQIVELGRAVGELVEVVRGVAPGAQVVRDATGLSPETPVVVE